MLQLRVIRAFRSTLEDMEEKRSVHSMRSTRSYLNRPMSDISYVDEETMLSPTGTSNTSRQRSSGNGSSNNNKGMRSHLVTESSTNQQYLKVEAGYRLQRQPQAKPLHQRDSLQSRASADAQTQSAESSFNRQLSETDSVGEYAAAATAAAAPCVQIVSSSPQPPPPPRVASPLLIQPVVSASPVPAVTVQHAGGALQTHLLPSPIYGFGYDPTYCQYLGQGADGYQYELVRRPSIGNVPPPAAAAVPQEQLSRRASGHGIPYLTPNSMQGSFDSAGGPPPSTTPIFIQQQQPLSPRHLHYNTQPSPAHRSNEFGGGGGGGGGNGPSNDIPKLIHETSI